MYFFAVAQNQHHWRFRLHLLLIIEIFRISLLGRGGPASTGTVAAVACVSAIPALGALRAVAALSHRRLAVHRRLGMVVVAAIQRRAHQPTVGEAVLVYGPHGWTGIGCIA